MCIWDFECNRFALESTVILIVITELCYEKRTLLDTLQGIDQSVLSIKLRLCFQNI